MARRRMSEDVCGCLFRRCPFIPWFGRMGAGREKDEFFCTHPAKVIRPDPLEKPWKWGVLESLPLSSPAG